MTVEFLTLSSPQQAPGLEFASSLRGGAAAEARVVAMLGNGIARLALLGKTIEVITPQDLQVGARLSVAVVRDGANLKLVVQGDAQEHPPAAPAGSAALLRPIEAGNLAAAARAAINGALLGNDTGLQGLGKTQQAVPPAQAQPAATAATLGAAATPATALPKEPEAYAQFQAAVQAAITGALLAGHTDVHGPGKTQQTASPAQSQPAATASTPAAAATAPPKQQEALVQVQAGVRARFELELPSQAPAIANSPAVASPAPYRGAPVTQQQAAALPAMYAQAAAQSPAQNPAQVVVVPFQLPQMAEPVPLRIERQDEDDAANGKGSASKRSWTVGVSADAGAMGLVHIAIGLRDNAVSVKLSCEDTQGAASFSAWLPELKTALEQADFVPGDLSVVEAPGAQTLSGIAPSQSQSFTI